MSIRDYILQARTFALKMANNPYFYISGFIGALVGLGVGGSVGAVCGGFLGYNLKLLGQCISLPWGIDASMSLGVAMGLGIGAALTAVTIGTLTIIKIFYQTKSYAVVYDNTQVVILSSLRFSVELASGIGVGGIIGSLANPGYGTFTGGLFGLIVMLIINTCKSALK